MIIRPAQVNDAAALHRICQKALGKSARSIDDTADSLKHMLVIPAFYCIEVAEEDSEVIGFFEGMDYNSCSFGYCKYLMTLAVDPDQQGKGVGRALLNRFEEWAFSQGAERVFLISGSERTNAHLFYEAMGYELRKTHHNYVKQL